MKELKVIARIRTGFPEKFGIPRQAGLAPLAGGVIVFEPEYRSEEALRGIIGYSHLWLIWEFSRARTETWRPTVRPPRLGGNRRMGVFATRSPYRPNPIGLSSVRLLGMRKTDEGTVLDVAGVDLLDGTPIYDIKPYLAYTDSHPDAVGGFADGVMDYSLSVEFPEELLSRVPEATRETVVSLLEGDPRPQYQNDPERIYGMIYGELEVHFRVEDGTLYVVDVNKR